MIYLSFQIDLYILANSKKIQLNIIYAILPFEGIIEALNMRSKFFSLKYD